MLDEQIIDLIIAIYSILSTIIFGITCIKRKFLSIWFIGCISFSIGAVGFYLRFLNEMFRLLGDIFYLLTIIIFIVAIFYEYNYVFRKGEKLQNNSNYLKSLFLVFASFSINFILIVMVVLLFIVLTILLRIYLKQKSITHISMFLTMMVGLFTVINTILNNIGIEGTWELSYVGNIAFITFLLITALAAPIEDRIQRSEIKYQELYEESEGLINSLPGLFYLFTKEGRYVKWNKELERVTGYSHDEIMMRNFLDFFPSHEKEKVANAFQRDLKEGYADVEAEVLTKNNQRIPYFFTLFYFKTESRDSIIGIGLDITEIKKAEENLRKSEEKYRYLFNNAQVGLYWSGINDGKILECNDTFAKLFGFDTREECLANYSAIEHYIDPNTRSELIEEIRVNKEIKNYEIHVTRRDGAPIWLSLSTRMFEKEDRFEGAAIDITERKIAERELQLERDNFINILNSMVDGVYIVDSNYDIEYVNPILIKEFGPFEGIKCFNYFNDRNEVCPWCKNKEIAQGKSARWEWYSFKNQKTYDLVDTPLKNPDGSISKLEIFRDISDIKQKEQELIESEKKYREAYNRAEFYKDIFTHDINNILQIILSGIQISQLHLDDPEKHDTLRRNAQVIKEQVTRGAKLVSNVRKLSQLEEVEQNLETIEILNILTKVISNVTRSYKDKNINIRIDSVAEKFFTKTNNFLEDVFENLLINAIIHNKNPTIEIIVKILKEQQNGINYVKIEFLDNGIGVADSMKDRIFIRGNRKEEIYLGMGLGLSLVRGIIETYNGKIWVEDVVKGDRSKGSNFVVLIPEVD